MQDFYEAPDRPSAFKPVMYGAAVGLGLTVIFVAAYLMAPNLTMPATCALAVAIAAVVAIALNYFPSYAGEDLAAMAMGDAPTHLGDLHDHHATESRVDGVSTKDLEADVARLREQVETIKRGERPVEWVAVLRETADKLKELGTRALATPGRSSQRTALNYFKQASSNYRKVVDARGKNRSDRHWAVARISLAECQLILGEAASARDQIMGAANGFSAALDVKELSAEERSAGENGLAQAEGILAGMGEQDEQDGGDLI